MFKTIVTLHEDGTFTLELVDYEEKTKMIFTHDEIKDAGLFSVSGMATFACKEMAKWYRKTRTETAE